MISDTAGLSLRGNPPVPYSTASQHFLKSEVERLPFQLATCSPPPKLPAVSASGYVSDRLRDQIAASFFFSLHAPQQVLLIRCVELSSGPKLRLSPPPPAKSRYLQNFHDRQADGTFPIPIGSVRLPTASLQVS